ncbi:MAG: hypothetical protein ABI882_06430 [Acidobacteriota bacterium]
MTVKKLIVGTMLLMAVSVSGHAQTPAQQEEKPKAESRSPYRVVVFDVKHRNPNALAAALVGSGAPGTQIIPNRELKTITVRDYPENILVIGEAIKRFDIPAPDITAVPDSLELQLHLIAASQTPSDKASAPVALEKAIQQMKATLKYADYRFLTTLSSRVIDGGSIHGNGFINPPFAVAGSNLKSSYKYALQQVRIITDAAGKEAYQIKRFAFEISVPIASPNPGTGPQLQNVGIETELSLREGETAVVGTANVGGSDEAIIVVVTAKKVK